MSGNDQSVADRLLGTWTLIGAEYKEQGGEEEVIPYLGTSPTGMLMYTSKGHMSVQVRIEASMRLPITGCMQ